MDASYSNPSGTSDVGAKRKKLKPGDVLLLSAPDVFAHLHYIGRHPEYGDAILVSHRLPNAQAEVTRDAFSGGYVTFYPAGAAVAEGLIEVIGNLPPPSLPTRLRRAGARSGRHVETWIIEAASGQTIKRTLSDDEMQLPIAAIWNHELLLQRVREGWRPQEEGRPL